MASSYNDRYWLEDESEEEVIAARRAEEVAGDSDSFGDTVQRSYATG